MSNKFKDKYYKSKIINIKNNLKFINSYSLNLKEFKIIIRNLKINNDIEGLLIIIKGK